MRPIISILALVALAACNRGRDADQTARSAPYAPKVASEVAAPAPSALAAGNAADRALPMPATASDSGATALPNAPGGRMIVRNGTASLEVDSLDRGIQQVQALAQRAGGYVGNTMVQAGHDALRSATVELRIPAAAFDDVLRGLRPLGRLETVNVTAEDVSEEYVDVGARVANARRLEERLTVLLATRTGKLADVLAVERELARVREEIERYEGRLRFLRTRAALATLAVTVHEPGPLVGTPGAGPIAEAARQAWRNFVGFTAWLIAASGVLVPLALLAALAIFLLRRGGRWPRRRHGEPLAPDSATTSPS